MKKILSILWGISILTLSTISYMFAYTQEQQEAYQWAYKYWITTQPTIESANLNGNVTRQAFAKMVVNYLEKAVWIRQSASNSCYFPDESKITNDLKPYTKKTCAYNIMWSNWKNFNPTQPVDRAQLWTVLSRVLWWDEYNANGKQYYIYHLNALKQNGLMNKIDNPNAYAKRWDVLIMLKRIYEKFGSNVSMNWDQTSAYTDAKTTNNINSDKSTNNKDTDNKVVNIEDDEDDDYISVVYSNSNVVYTWKNGTKYHYDADFLNMLDDEANKKWELDLVKYLEIEAKYYVNWLDQLESLDMDNLPEMLWIDEDINPETMTKKEKEELLKKIKDWVNKIIKENKDKNNEYVNKLQKVTKNISDDKFWLKEKYKETKEFMDTTDSFLVLYSEIIFEVMEMALTSEEWEIDDESGMGMVFWLMAAALAYQGEAEKYQWYLEDWASNVTKILIDGVDSSKIVREDTSTSDDTNSLLRANQRAKDVARKNDLAQIQVAIVTSQQDTWKWPGMNAATKWIPVSNIRNELIQAWMSTIPTDPVETNKVSWLGTTETTKWEYAYIVTKRNWTNNWWFVLMANTENEWSSNWIVCENKSWLSNWYITNDTDLKDIKVCETLKKWNSCSASTCTYTDEDELRYILMY